MASSFQLDSGTASTLFLQLYRNVKNVPQLRKRLMNGDLQCCIIKPTLITHPFQVVVAANKAVVAEKLTTKTIYTEILFNLSISKNITRSLQTFGVDDHNTDILVAVIKQRDDEDDVLKAFDEVDGDEVNLLVLDGIRNETEIKEAYKISETEINCIPLLDSVVTKIAIKDCL